MPANGPADEAAVRPLLMEVLRTVEAYRATDPNKLDQVVIAGDTGLEACLAEVLRSRITAPSSPYDPSWTIAIEKDRAAQMTGFSAVLGLLAGEMAPEIARFDFHSPKTPVDKVALRRKQVIAVGSAALVLVAGIYLSTSSYIASMEKQKAGLTDRIAVLKKQADAVDAIGKRVATADKWMKQDLVWLDKLRDVIQQLPENQKGYMPKLIAKATSGDVLDAHELQMPGLRMSDWQVPTNIQKSLGASKQFAVKLGQSRETLDPKYGYTGDVTIVILPDKAKPGAKPAAKPASRPASQPAPALASAPAAPEDQPVDPTSTPAQPAEDHDLMTQRERKLAVIFGGAVGLLAVWFSLPRRHPRSDLEGPG